MPEPTNPLAVNITQIDALASLDLPNRDDWHKLVTVIEGTQAKLDVLSTSLDKSISAQSKLADFYSEGGFSPIASRTTGNQADIAQSGPGGPTSPGDLVLPPGVTREQTAKQKVAQEADQASTMERRFAKFLDMMPGTNLSGSGGGGAGASRPPGAGPLGAGPPDAGGGAGPGVGGWLTQVGGQNNNILQDPRQFGGTVTPQQVLMTAGSALSEPYRDQYAKYQAGTGPRPDFNVKTAVGTGLLAAGQYGAPAYHSAHSIIGKVGQFSQQTQDYGELLGTSSGTSASIFGQRIPFTGASFKGLTQGISDKIKGIFSGGISGEQIGEIRTGLAEQGWTPENSRTSGMQSGFESLFKEDQGSARAILNQGLMDKAVREGSVTTDAFTRSMKNYRDSANDAKISVEALAAAQDAYGQANEAAGGTAYGGQQTALAVARTGYDPTELQGLVYNNPWTQGSTMRQTGLPPWQQGTLSPGMRLSTALQGFQEAAGMMQQPGTTVPIKGLVDQETGKTGVEAISSSKMTAANMSLIPGMDQIPTQVRQKMIEHPSMVRGMIQGQQLGAAADQWVADVGNHPNLLNNYQTGVDQGDLMNMAKQSINPMTGGRLLTDDELDQVKSAGDDGDRPKQIAQARSAKLKEILASKQSDITNQVQAGGVTIELGESAKRAFHLEDHRTSGKSDAGAGVGTTNAAFGSGATSIPPYSDGYVSGTDSVSGQPWLHVPQGG